MSDMMTNKVIRHVEGADGRSGDSPNFGAPSARMLRNAATMGITPNMRHPSKRPDDSVRVSNEYCICAFDIEREYKGEYTCNILSPILCMSIVCSCGKSWWVTRKLVDQHDMGDTTQILLGRREDFLPTLVAVLSDHCPNMIVGYNST